MLASGRPSKLLRRSVFWGNTRGSSSLSFLARFVFRRSLAHPALLVEVFLQFPGAPFVNNKETNVSCSFPFADGLYFWDATFLSSLEPFGGHAQLPWAPACNERFDIAECVGLELNAPLWTMPGLFLCWALRLARNDPRGYPEDTKAMVFAGTELM